MGWYQNQRPRMTLNGVMAVILRYYTNGVIFWSQLRQIGWS